jgi:hypothetical protein
MLQRKQQNKVLTVISFVPSGKCLSTCRSYMNGRIGVSKQKLRRSWEASQHRRINQSTNLVIWKLIELFPIRKRGVSGASPSVEVDDCPIAGMGNLLVSILKVDSHVARRVHFLLGAIGECDLAVPIRVQTLHLPIRVLFHLLNAAAVVVVAGVGTLSVRER